MTKTLYEGYRVGKNGGERWSGTVSREVRSGRYIDSSRSSSSNAQAGARSNPKGGSAVSGTFSKPNKK